jgi:hypothetical protein
MVCFSALAERGIIDVALGERLRAAVGLEISWRINTACWTSPGSRVARVDVADLLWSASS